MKKKSQIPLYLLNIMCFIWLGDVFMNFLKYGPIKALIAILSLLVLIPSALSVSNRVVHENISLQNEHMDYLRNEFYQTYTPKAESRLTAFDLDKAITDKVKFNEVSFIGTHNSYQLAATKEYARVFQAIDTATFGLISADRANFSMEPLTSQLEVGIRSFELDIQTVVENGKTGFTVSHIPFLDEPSNCYRLESALEEIKLWSDANPKHLPITLMIEPKEYLLPLRNMRGFTADYAAELDTLLREVFGETLLTPADMMGTHSSLKEMREQDDWLPLGDTMGEILVLLHDTSITHSYVMRDESIKTQAMFPMLSYGERDRSYASFILDNDPSDALSHKSELIDRCHLIVRTRADSFTNRDEKTAQAAIQSGAQILSTDYPPKTDGASSEVFAFDGGYLVKLSSAK